MRGNFGRRSAVVAAILATLLSCLVLSTARAMDYGSQLLDTYYRVQDEVLFPTETGRRYIDHFYYYSNETWQLSLAHPEIMEAATRGFLGFEPPLRALVEGNGSEVHVTQEMVDQVEEFLDLLAQHASPGFQATIETERSRVRLSALVGLSFDDARILLLGVPEVDPPGAPPTRIPMPTAQ